MSRRSHLTDVASIACNEVDQLGAGEKEGWLSDASVLTALHHRRLAVASAARSLVVLLEWDPESTSSSLYPPINIRPSLASDEGSITAVEWVDSGQLIALAVGTSAGYLLLYSLGSDLIHKQMVHPGHILRLRFRESNSDSMPDMPSMELCVVMPGVIARFDGSDIQSLLQRWFQEADARGWGYKLQKGVVHEDSYSTIPFQIWNVGKYGLCADAAIVGLMPPPLLELQQSSQRYYCAVTIGDDAVVSAYRVSENRSRSLVGAILSKVVPATFSTIASFSRIIWRSGQTSTKKPRPPSQQFSKASPLTCLKDPPRKGEKLTLSPSGTLAAITDSLGRILLLDTKALVVVRLWKGYRDANCLFLDMLVKREASSSSNFYGQKKSDYCMCLAIHAPRKGIIEIWKMRTGPRLHTIQCPNGSRILQPSTKFVSSDSLSSFIPLEVFLLNGDSGQLSRLNSFIG